MKANTDKDTMLELYESMYGEKNSTAQVDEAVNTHVKSTKKKRRRIRSRKSRSGKILEETNNGQESHNESVDEPKTGESKDMSKMNKFDELYNTAINEQLDADVDFEAPMDADVDAFGGEEEDTEVTITLDRDVAQKLCEVIQAAIGDDEVGEEGEEETDDFGDEAGFAGGVEEEGAGEDSLSTAPDGVSKMTKGSLSAGATQNIGDQTHQSGRGAMAAKKPATPKPLTHKTS